MKVHFLTRRYVSYNLLNFFIYIILHNSQLWRIWCIFPPWYLIQPMYIIWVINTLHEKLASLCVPLYMSALFWVPCFYTANLMEWHILTCCIRKALNLLQIISFVKWRMRPWAEIENIHPSFFINLLIICCRSWVCKNSLLLWCKIIRCTIHAIAVICCYAWHHYNFHYYTI
jgi:hypothetical protein